MSPRLGSLDRLAALGEQLATPLLPAWGLVHLLHPRLRVDLRERWGLTVAPVEPGAVWIVASSVGEVAAAEALLPHLAGPVLLTADTDTGAHAARKAVRGFSRAVAAARPVDHPWVIAPLWAEARPRSILFIEGAWWPGLARLAHRDGVPMLAVQARPSKRPLPGWRAGLCAVAARGATEAERLAQAGLRVVATGDLKADRTPASPPLPGLQGAIVGASTRSARVELALVRAAQEVAPDRRVVIAPRHPARFSSCWQALRSAGVDVERRSALTGPPRSRVLLLDSIGELAGVLSVAGASLIGGTFDSSVGGHSPAESLRGGGGVLAGPHRHSHPGAFVEVSPVSQDLSDLSAALDMALRRPRAPHPPSGAGAEIARALRPWLQRPPSPERPPRPWARPLAPFFELELASRHRSLPARLDVPVFAVGSANVRGAYKTAAAAWVASHLRRQGLKVGVVVRGHGRTRLGGPRRGTAHSDLTLDASHLGDDGARLALAGWTVAAGPDRLDACRALLRSGCTALVLEDGLRDRGVAADEVLAVVDRRAPDGRGPFPAGERRGPRIPPHATVELWVGEGPAPETGLPCALLTPHPGPWHRGSDPAPPPPFATAVLGVGAPGAALRALRDGPMIEEIVRLADHAPIEATVRALLDHGASIVTTAKDAARVGPAIRAQLWWREIELRGEWPLGPIGSPLVSREDL